MNFKNSIFIGFFSYFLSLFAFSSPQCLEAYIKGSLAPKAQANTILEEIRQALEKDPHGYHQLVIANTVTSHLERLTETYQDLMDKVSAAGTNNSIQFSLQLAATTIESFNKVAEKLSKELKKENPTSKQNNSVVEDFKTCLANLSTCEVSLQKALNESTLHLRQAENLITELTQKLSELKEVHAQLISSESLFGTRDNSLNGLIAESIDSQMLIIKSYQEMIQDALNLGKQQKSLILAKLAATIPEARARGLFLKATFSIPLESREVNQGKAEEAVAEKGKVPRRFVRALEQSQLTPLGKKIIDLIKTTKLRSDEVTGQMVFLQQQEPEGLGRLYSLKDITTIVTTMLDRDSGKFRFYSDDQPIYLQDLSGNNKHEWHSYRNFLAPEILLFFVGKISDKLLEDYLYWCLQKYESKYEKMFSEFNKFSRENRIKRLFSYDVKRTILDREDYLLSFGADIGAFKSNMFISADHRNLVNFIRELSIAGVQSIKIIAKKFTVLVPLKVDPAYYMEEVD